MPKPRRHARDYYQNAPFISPEWFDAVPGGTVDSSNQLVRAMAEAAEDGRALDGHGLTYGVDFANIGALDALTGTKMHNMTLKQLSPSASQSVITFSAVGVSNVELKAFKINRNGTGANSGTNAAPNAALDTARGFHIEGGTGHWIEDIEVYGNDSGSGGYFVDLDETSTIIRPYAHDIMGVAFGVTDDQVGGFLFKNCDGLSVYHPIVQRLGWRSLIGDATTYVYSRGIGFTGCENIRVYSAWAEDCWQGIDCTGNVGNGNIDLRFYAPVAKNCTIYGLKTANNCKRIFYIDGVADNCTSIGFVNNAGYDTTISDFDAVQYINCVAVNCGNGVGTNGGFANLPGTRTYPNLAHFINCRAYDTRGTPLMGYGFYNEVASRTDAMARAINCKSSGHVTAGIQGFDNENMNSSVVASIGPPFSTDTYLPGSVMTVRPFDLAAKTQYHCRFMMEKTAAGVATPIITVRFGAAGTTADAALGTLTFSAQTAAIDKGMVEIWGTFRVVSATVARVACVGQLSHNSQTTGLGTTGQETQRFESADFNSALASAKLGISVNAGASAAWTVFLVHSEIIYPYQ